MLVSRNSLRIERGYFILISNTGCATDCFPPNTQKAISQTGVHAWCKSQSGIFQVRLNHWYKKCSPGMGGQQTKLPSKRSNLSANFAANRVDVIRPGQGVIDNDPEQASLLNKFHFSAIKIDPEIDCWHPWSWRRDQHCDSLSRNNFQPTVVQTWFSLLRTDETRSQAAVGDSEDAYSVKSSANDGRRAPCAVAKSAKSDT